MPIRPGIYIKFMPTTGFKREMRLPVYPVPPPPIEPDTQWTFILADGKQLMTADGRQFAARSA